MDRIILSIDGNCACALLGEDLQSGEAEFVEIDPMFEDMKKRHPQVSQFEAAKCCAYVALDRLRHRLGPHDLAYALRSGLSC
jgi:hypothetical protein